MTTSGKSEWRLNYLLGGNYVPPLVDRTVVSRSLRWELWSVRRFIVTDRWRLEGSSRLVTSATAERLWYSTYIERAPNPNVMYIFKDHGR